MLWSCGCLQGRSAKLDFAFRWYPHVPHQARLDTYVLGAQQANSGVPALCSGTSFCLPWTESCLTRVTERLPQNGHNKRIAFFRHRYCYYCVHLEHGEIWRLPVHSDLQGCLQLAIHITSKLSAIPVLYIRSLVIFGLGVGIERAIISILEVTNLKTYCMFGVLILVKYL
jgi:hypothetical protein